MKRPGKRQLALGGLLLASVLAAVWVSDDSTPTSLVEATTPPKKGRQERASLLPLATRGGTAGIEALTPRSMSQDFSDLFVVPPPEKPHASTKEVELKPVAPPLPLKYMGRMTQDGKPVLFLVWNDKNLAVKVGETVEDTYRLEAIAAGQAEFMYLPLKQKQTLSIGEGS